MVGSLFLAKMMSIRPMAIGAVVLALGVGGRVRGVETEAFQARLAEVVRGTDPAVALRVLDALAAEALQAGRLDLRVQATAAHARLRIKAGDFSRVRQDLEEARSEARSGGWPALEAEVCEVFSDYWLAQGDAVAAAEWLEVAWTAALAASPSDTGLAMSVLERLESLRQSLGQDHLASQARAWRSLLVGDPEAPAPEVLLQPTALTTQVAAEEVGRARLFLANATAEAVTGTLLIDGGDLTVGSWASQGANEQVTLQFPAASGAVPQSTAQGRKLTLMPGETRTLTLEVEPNAPPRPGTKSVSVAWQSGAASLTATAEFHFRKARDLPSTTVANACQVRLSPLVSVPVFMEVYHRGRPQRHIQDLLPVTSQPCRVELHEILADGARGRQWLSVDADGDGRYFGAADAVASDLDGSGYPDVEFSADKEVAALEVRLFPLTAADGAPPETLDLTVSLRDGGKWREPADVSHRVEVGR
jgi:hypothetical protein